MVVIFVIYAMLMVYVMFTIFVWFGGSMDINEKLLEFIKMSPTAYQAVENVAESLQERGFVCDNEGFTRQGGLGFTIRNGSSLIAWKIPKGVAADKIKGFHIVCAHTDSPMFKLKENAEVSDGNGYVKLNVEKYGGMIVNTWLDRPLSVAGRVVFEKDGALKTESVDLKKPLYIIPNLAIHMTRGGEEKSLSIQTDLQPIGDNGIYELISKAIGCADSDILGTDLYLYNAQEGCVAGSSKSLVCAPRLDDLQCVYTALKGFEEAESSVYINVLGIFDNEEVGSLSRQGAASDYLANTLKDIAGKLGISGIHYRAMLGESFMISADNAHAIHPNHPEKADTVNRPRLNGGIVIKYHGGQKYTTDAYTGAFVKQICRNNNIPYQIYHNNSDVAGGSTLGNLVQANVSIPAADVGAAQLAMHSCFETAGAEDTQRMYEFMKAFYGI